MIYKIIICFIASMGAGIGTGFAGLSAAVVISPLLITFLDIPAYEAIGIALSSDVLASAISAYMYGKNKNLDIRNGMIMMITVLLFTFIGSFLASLMPNTTMGNFSVAMTLILGIRFVLCPITTTKDSRQSISRKQQIFQSILCGTVIGFICGFVGAGGGLMMLFILTSVLRYELKTAVGTSVFIMAFTALTGAVSHFAIGGMQDIWCLLFCVIFTFIWARVAASFANKVSTEKLNRATGAALIIIGGVILLANIFG